MADTIGPDPVRATNRFRLRILATSDLHANVMPYDYAADRPLVGAGLARVAQLIRKARAEVANSITLDNGDFIEGNPLGELLAAGGQLPEGRVHPVIAAMNAVGYDAVGLGNHEFSYGVAFLERALRDTTFPVLSANAVRGLGMEPTEDTPFCPPVHILTREVTNDCGATATLRIGLLSVLPPQVEIWEHKHLFGRIYTRDIVEAAAAWAPRLKAMGADVVVALCHSGIAEPVHSVRMENAAIPLARIPDIDVVIAGHTHLAFPGPDIPASPEVDPASGTICGKPAVKAGYWGSHLGIIDLDLAQTPDGWHLIASQSRTEPVADRKPGTPARARVRSDPRVVRVVSASHKDTIDYVRRPIAETDVALHSYFGRVGGSAAVQLIHEAQLDWLERTLKGTPHAGLPLVSAASPIKSGGRNAPHYFTDIPAGPLLIRHIHTLYPFPNAIRALRVTGRLLAGWLERSASQFLQLTPGGADQPLLDPDVPAYNFDTLAGVSYDLDLSAPARHDANGRVINPEARRVQNLQLDGRPLAPDTKLAIVTHNYRAAGGGNFLSENVELLDEPMTLVTEVLLDYVRAQGHLNPRPATNWRLTGLPPGTTAWFDTGPGARAHLDEAAALGIEPIAETEAGFLRCRLRF